MISYTVFDNHRKVSFNIVSEASYVYRQKNHIKNAKMVSFKPEANGQTVFPYSSLLKGQKLMKNAKMANFGNLKL